MTKRIRMLVGPNGSGKTTLYHALTEIIQIHHFINADDIKLILEKQGYVSLPFDCKQDELVHAFLSSSFSDSVKCSATDGSIRCDGRNVSFTKESINTYSVAALTDFFRQAYMRRGLTFAMETVFSHPSKLDFLAQACNLGYRVYLYFVATENPRLNIARVQQRVTEGGHDVPEAKIIERYHRCLNNFYAALQFAYRAYFFDNSKEMKFFAERKPDYSIEFTEDPPKWFVKYILEKAGER